MSARVLIVDDDASIRSLLVGLLIDEGYEVDEAPNGLEALQRLTDYKPDVVLLDLLMPIMDGWGFLDQSRAMPQSQALPVVVLSASHLSRRIHGSAPFSTSHSISTPWPKQ